MTHQQDTTISSFVMILDGWRRICYCSPQLEQLYGARLLGLPVEKIADVRSRSGIIQRCSSAILRSESSQWLLTDGLVGETWLARVESITTSKGSARAVLTLSRACAKVERLSSNQRAVLRHLARQRSISHIAKDMQVSETTIRTHLRRAREATQQVSLVHLAAWAGANQAAL